MKSNVVRAGRVPATPLRRRPLTEAESALSELKGGAVSHRVVCVP